MLMLGKRSLSFILRIVTDVLLVINGICLIALPWLLRWIYASPGIYEQIDPGGIGPANTGADAYGFGFYLAFLYVAGLATAWILISGHRLLRQLERNQPFAAANARSLRHIAAASAILMLVFAVKIVLYNTILTMFCAALFLCLAVIALILAEVFRQASLVKDENDLTI